LRDRIRTTVCVDHDFLRYHQRSTTRRDRSLYTTLETSGLVAAAEVEDSVTLHLWPTLLVDGISPTPPSSPAVNIVNSSCQDVLLDPSYISCHPDTLLHSVSPSPSLHAGAVHPRNKGPVQNPASAPSTANASDRIDPSFGFLLLAVSSCTPPFGIPGDGVDGCWWAGASPQPPDSTLLTCFAR
jgi:hypothetical protein